MSRLLGRGLLAGLAGGLIAFAFAHTVGETPIGQAIAFEDAHSPDGRRPGARQPGRPEHRRPAHRHCVFGLALGGLFALTFAAVQGRVSGSARRHRRRCSRSPAT